MEKVKIPESRTSMVDLLATTPITCMAGIISGDIYLAAGVPMLTTLIAVVSEGYQLYRYDNAINKLGISFEEFYKTPVEQAPKIDVDTRLKSIISLTEKVNDGYTRDRRMLWQKASRAKSAVQKYVERHTGKKVEFSARVHTMGLTNITDADCTGVKSDNSGRIYILKRTGCLEPIILTHEFIHKLGISKESHTQIMSYYALQESEDKMLIQSADAELLKCNIDSLPEEFGSIDDRLTQFGVRSEIIDDYRKFDKKKWYIPQKYESWLDTIYEEELKMRDKEGNRAYTETFSNYIFYNDNLKKR